MIHKVILNNCKPTLGETWLLWYTKRRRVIFVKPKTTYPPFKEVKLKFFNCNNPYHFMGNYKRSTNLTENANGLL